MTRTGDRPSTRTHNPEPAKGTEDWVIWAAWADRVTFDEIQERTGLTEKDVIKIMRRKLKPSSFRLWRKRVTGRSTKHRKRFVMARDDY
ncbi:MAG: TIGR03643 family protein [Pseudomonadota bacterium]